MKTKENFNRQFFVCPPLRITNKDSIRFNEAGSYGFDFKYYKMYNLECRLDFFKISN